MIEHLITEQAKKALGQDFLGIGAVRNLEDKLHGVGVEVEFVVDEVLEALRPVEAELRKLKAMGVADWKIALADSTLCFPYYSMADYMAARMNNEMLVLRPKAMRRDGRELPLTLRNFADLFSEDPTKKLTDLFHRGVFHRLGADSVWFRQAYSTQEDTMTPGYALVTKDILPDSNGLTYEQQDGVLKKYAEHLEFQGVPDTNVRRRTALETAYDTILYYVNTGGGILLAKNFDRVQTEDKYGQKIVMGNFSQRLGASGLKIIACSADATKGPWNEYEIGVCSNR